jgi:hypothetical protein
VFAAAQLLPGSVQGYASITGVSVDRMTLFVEIPWSTDILVRGSLQQAFGPPMVAAMPPFQAWRSKPLNACGLLMGTCEPGGCANEQICVWASK